MATGTGGTTCHNCGQSNAGNGQFCVRCGDRLPDPNATTVGTAPAPESTWEPPPEWNPDPSWGDGASSGPAQRWDENSRSWGPAGGPGPYQQGTGQQGAYQQGTFQQTPPPGFRPPGPAAPQPGSPYQGTPPPGYAPTGPTGSGGRHSRTPLFAGLGALIVVALVVLGIVLATSGGKDRGTTSPPAPATPVTNGEENKTPAAVLDDARVNLRTTSGVHAAGNVTSDGQDIRLDLDFAGNATKGVLTIGGNDVQIVKVGSDVYLKGDRDFYLSVANGDTAAVDAIGDKWLKADGTDAKEFDEFSLDGFADAFKVNDGDAKLNPTLGRDVVAGQPTVVLTQTDGSRLLVADTGKAYPLRLENKTPADAGRIDFTNFDAPVQIAPPAAGDVLDLSQVG
jgi:hypothetical protein